tara:strand:- start:976 stop:1350 length:375 start_codon:yes stop_codon:yes gene_type:complete
MTTTPNSSLPNTGITTDDSNKMFNRFYKEDFFYKPSEVDAVIGYFLKRGFDKVAAINTASIVLQQSSKDKLPAFELLDTLKGVSDVQLNNIVAQILNLNRSSCSTVGYRVRTNNILYDQRNIII